MFFFRSASLLAAAEFLLLLTSSAPALAAPTPDVADTAATGNFWLGNMKHQGTVAPFGAGGYQIFRNVKDFGAKGDGSTDDTAAINQAISTGNRCGQGCDSSTVTPAIIYFPPGTYVVSKPLNQYYYTQMIGDATNLPVLKAAAGFQGMAVIDSDPYADGGVNWFTNQNNFFRQVRNFVIDLRAMPPSAGAGIHWQVGQATSIQNVRFEMIQGGADNKQQGIFMDNGSGGFFTDLIFNGGNYGAFLGNQQFTTRNLTFNNCNTAIFMNWNWGWTLKSITVNNCNIGIDMANSPSNQTVGSVLLLDSKFTNVNVGVNSAFGQNSVPVAGGTLIVDNVDFTGAKTAVKSAASASALAGGSVVKTWVQGSIYQGTQRTRTFSTVSGPTKPAGLLSGGKFYERSKPQYEGLPASSFVSVKDSGAKGDGTTDDTAAIQKAMDSLPAGKVLFFDHGYYVVTSTINVPKNIKITGEIWPLIMAKGSFFGDQSKPQPVFQVGNVGDTGAVEISDLIFETMGSAAGAIMIQWNLNGAQGANGLWDTHVRIGGSAGTQLQSNTCSKAPQSDHSTPNPNCIGAYLMFHATQQASVYLENTWFWVSDHELDLTDHNQIDIYNGRGVLLESQNPVWLYGTASEHSVLYQYQLSKAKNVFMGFIQTETAYYQSNPQAPAPFTVAAATDPKFTGNNKLVNKGWGLRIVDSSDVAIYGAGLYSFFENYGQTCLDGENCQTNMVSYEGTNSNVVLYGLSTKAAANMITVNGNGVALDKDNRSNFCASLALFFQ